MQSGAQKAWGRLVTVLIRRKVLLGGAHLFSRAPQGRAKTNRWNVLEGRLWINLSKSLLIIRVFQSGTGLLGSLLSVTGEPTQSQVRQDVKERVQGWAAETQIGTKLVHLLCGPRQVP